MGPTFRILLSNGQCLDTIGEYVFPIRNVGSRYGGYNLQLWALTQTTNILHPQLWLLLLTFPCIDYFSPIFKGVGLSHLLFPFPSLPSSHQFLKEQEFVVPDDYDVANHQLQGSHHASFGEARMPTRTVKKKDPDGYAPETILCPHKQEDFLSNSLFN